MKIPDCRRRLVEDRPNWSGYAGHHKTILHDWPGIPASLPTSAGGINKQVCSDHVVCFVDFEMALASDDRRQENNSRRGRSVREIEMISATPRVCK